MPGLTRVGILCVHGMGNQSAGEHVAGIARAFYKSIIKHYGEGNVSVEYRPNDRVVKIYVRRSGDRDVLIELVESFWRDLGEPHGFIRLMRFWWWALTLWATSGFKIIDSMETSNWVIAPIERLRLFFYSMVFFILLLPFRMVLTLISYIPFVNRVDLFATIYFYMSSVKIYQENPRRKQARDFLEDVEPRRVWIQRRFANSVLDMAESNYDRWGIFCHSLGSVIVYKGLQYEPSHWAWFLDRWRLQRLAKKFLISLPEPISSPIDVPKRPLWIEPSANGINRSEIFSKFVGVVSYGSPLETFAKLWPGLIENSERSEYFRSFDWINLYDIRDFISSQIKTARVAEYGGLTNLAVDSHALIFKAHTEYMRKSEGNREVSHALFRWFIDGDRSNIDLLVEKRNKVRENLHIMSLILQALFVLTIGILMLPLAVVAFFGIAGRAFGSLIKLISHEDNIISKFFDGLADLVDPTIKGPFSISEYLYYCWTEVLLFIIFILLAGGLRRFLRFVGK